MDRERHNSCMAAVLVACFFLVAGIMPAIAFPAELYGRDTGAGSELSLRTDKLAGYGSDSSGVLGGKGSLIGGLKDWSSIPVGPADDTSSPRGEDGSGVPPDESQPGTRAGGAGSQTSSVVSGKGALLDAIAGRIKSPENQAVGVSLSVSGEGTVHFIESNGGFFGIITPEGEKYRPGNLPIAMRVEGTRIRFVGVAKVPAPGTEGGGTPLSLISINILSDQISASGTVRYIGIEGGFFGIITPDGRKYLPLNLPIEFQVDGMPVTFTAREKPDAATTAMWGKPVELDSIESSGSQFLSLEGSWSLLKCGGQPLIPGTTITAAFGSNGMVTGSAGCNQYFAPYSATGSSLKIGTAGSTMMYCSLPEGSMEQESAYLALLGEAAAWTIRGANLVIRDAQGREILVYASAVTDEPAPLIEYSRTGGVAGLDDHLVLFANGSGTVTSRGITRSVRVPHPLMEDLISHITAADFPTLKEHYPAPTEGADYFTYSLTAGGTTVVTEDTGIPPLLVTIINTLNDIVSSVRMSVQYGRSGIPNFF